MAQVVLADPYEMGIIASVIKTQMNTGTFGVANLYQNDYIPVPSSIISNFTVATFDGYVSKAVPFNNGPQRYGDGSYGVWSGFDWLMTGNTTPNVIYGLWVEDPTGALAFSVRFDTPVSMIDTFSQCQGVLAITFSQTQILTKLVLNP